MTKIRVLVVDDSLFMRRIISDILSRDPQIEVIGIASNGLEGYEKTLELSPDVVILDVQMPVMDGLTALKKIMQDKPTPVIMFSALTKKDALVTIRALEYGAVDFLAKPYGPISLDLSSVAEDLIRKVKAAAIAKIRMFKFPKAIAIKRRPKPLYGESPPVAVAIAASTGGPSALREVLAKIPGDVPAAFLIVQHMPPFFTKVLAEHLDARSELKVKEAENGELVMPGVAYIAPGGYHMEVIKVGKIVRIRLNKGPKINNVRPSADPLMISVAKAFGANSIGVVLTGMGSDGAIGMRAIKEAGGRTIVQDEETCVVPGMPLAALKLGVVDKVLPIWDIGDAVIQEIRTRSLKYVQRERLPGYV